VSNSTLLPRFGWRGYAAIGLIAIGWTILTNYPWASRFDAIIAWAVSGTVGVGLATVLIRSAVLDIRARRIAADAYLKWRRIVFEPHELVPVGDAELDPPERVFFESMQARFKELGFRRLVDLRNPTVLPDWPRERQIHRMLLDQDGVVRITLDQECVQGGDGTTTCRCPRVLATSEFSDGRFVITASALAHHDAADVDSPKIAIVEWQQMPVGTSPTELLQSHRLRLATLNAAAGAEPIRLQSVDDVVSSINRLQSIFIAHSPPLDLAEHVRRTTVDGRRGSLMRLVAKELQRLQACRQCGYDLTGNVSGICPECSAPMPSTQVQGVDRGE